ncbi:MAG: BamA/TamA family outer membrane protein [Rhizobacter sp.]|nr:BamA/TamA family outer membrane protein [Bacteriovorax sp.]
MKRFILIILVMFVCAQTWAAEFIPSKNANLKTIAWSTPAMKKRFGGFFKDLINKPYDALTLKIQLDTVTKELFTNGYFSAEVKPEISGNDNEVNVKINIVLHERINFEFRGNTVFSHQELRTKILDKIKNEFGKIDVQNLADFISDRYEDAGFYQTTVTYYQNQGADLEKTPVTNYFFVISEGIKIKIRDIIYRGNSYLKNGDIQKVLDKTGTPLAKGGWYDRKYFDEFSDILKKEYLSHGFVFVEISRPRVVTNDEDDSVTIEYGITEKQQVLLKQITFAQVPENLASKVKDKLVNKEGQPVNIPELENDLRKMIIYFQSEGYYFASITNLNSSTLLVYDKSYAFVELHPEISLDRQICFNEAIINGNVKTKSEVISREIAKRDFFTSHEMSIVQGDLITPEKLESLRQRLSGLNLFSSLRITPYMMYEAENTGCAKTNLVIQVKEKDFGLIEIAPGYRTDLGKKLSTGVTYNNLFGTNKSLSLRLQGNLRDNLTGFDDRRRNEDKNLFEYLTRASFTEPYLFHDYLKTQLEFEVSTEYQRIRFYGFDADVLRLSPQFSKTFTKWFSASVRYQYEKIVQFDATESKDNDNFNIGGVTPTLTFDFRDDPINPRKGAFFTLSSEWANSNFGSMKQADLEVNFIKLISRNRFYIPMGDFTLALSLAAGYQKNFAEDVLKDGTGKVILNANGVPKTRGYIPSIKVFRLDGYDEIRGYDDGEINRLLNGTPIGEIIVQNEAYFTALKFEPRYNITDAIQLGVFFDAGRVFVDNFEPTKLRTSVGAGLKYLTPVGSLDFDYGFKLQRKTYPDQSRDSVGRFHLSIGFF